MARKVAHRKKRQNRLGMFLVSLVIITMGIVVSVKGAELKEKRIYYQEREQELMEAIAAEEERTQEIEEYRKYTQTKKYIEEEAKSKLGLVYDGEIIFKDTQ